MSLSPQKRRAILALTEHGAVARAADACKLSRQTLYRWLREPEFAQALREESDSRVEQASRRLTALVDEAISVMSQLLKSDSEHVRRLTADSILSHGIRLRELVELTERISNLEKRV